MSKKKTTKKTTTKRKPKEQKKPLWPPVWEIPEGSSVSFPNDIFNGPGGNRCTLFYPTYPNEQDDESSSE